MSKIFFCPWIRDVWNPKSCFLQLFAVEWLWQRGSPVGLELGTFAITGDGCTLTVRHWQTIFMRSWETWNFGGCEAIGNYPLHSKPTSSGPNRIKRSEIFPLSVPLDSRLWHSAMLFCSFLMMKQTTAKAKRKCAKCLSPDQCSRGNLTWASEKGATEILFSTRMVEISPSRSPILPKTRTKCPFGYTDVDSQESMRTTTLKSCREGQERTWAQRQQ